jgi:PASTA domain
MRVGFVGLAVAALAAGWYFGVRPNETVIPEEAPAAPDVQLRDEKSHADEHAVTQRVTAFSGLQTTVPDTLGYDERTATRTLEDGGFRVRVMEHKVTSARDDGVVVQQLPRAGVTRRVGWIITIVVGRIR